MNEKSKGILIFSEWFEAMEKLSARDYKRLLSATYHYQIHNVQPPEFEGKAAILASMIFPYVEKRKKLSASGKKGMNVRL